MEMEQELEWKEAQKTVINVDLVAAAKRQLKFLAAVDRNRRLYEGPALEMAIFRYNFYWLPLLAKHSESPLFEGPLVVPLDCEWVWHCHRLNPVTYKSDCEKLYGIILDNHNVVSSVQGALKEETECAWKMLYPDMPYKMDPTAALPNDIFDQKCVIEKKCTKYDLVNAVKRQSSFFYQVDRPHMSNDLYLEGAVARYKGFLHQIKRNKERSIKSFTVPTYDIDLIWHTHQLHPSSYCKDLVAIMGMVLEHDDTDSDRTKGMKLDNGFSVTTKVWEERYGLRYWRAGAMYRGSLPSPLRNTPYSNLSFEKKNSAPKEDQKIINLPKTEVIEVMLEFVSVKNVPEHKGKLFVSFSKSQPDSIFNAKRSLTILSESGEKQVACFQCQPTGSFIYELMSHSSSNLPLSKPAKVMASGSISLEDLLSPRSNLTMEKWLEMAPNSSFKNSKPILLRVAISVTVPTPAPNMLYMVHSRPFSKSSCFFPLPGKLQLAKTWTCIIDDHGNEIISLQTREFKKSKDSKDSILRKEVIGVTESGGTHTCAEFSGNNWFLIDSSWSLELTGTIDEDGYIFKLTGDHHVKFFPGRRLDYELKHCEKQRNDQDFLTAIEVSAENPYGKAVALFDLKSGTLKVKEGWFLFPGLLSAFILGEIIRKEGYNFISSENNLKEKEFSSTELNECHLEEITLASDSLEGNSVQEAKGGTGFGSDCGSRYKGNVRSGGCGGCGGCGADCGGGGKILIKNGSSGGCGGCGGGCGTIVANGNSGGCGGCGGGCGSILANENSGGCGGCGGGGGCGGCGGGGCGSILANENSGGCGVNFKSRIKGSSEGCVTDFESMIKNGSAGVVGDNLVEDGGNIGKDCINEQGKTLLA